MTFLLVGITAFLGWHLQHLTFDFEFEKFFPKNHPESIAYAEHSSQFGYDNDYLQIILETEKGIFNDDFLKRATLFEQSLREIEDVESVYSPLSIQHAVKSPMGLVAFPLIKLKNTNREQLKKDSVRIFGNPLYRSSFSLDGKVMSIYLNHTHFDDQERSHRILSAINESAQKHNIEQIRMVGKLSAANVFVSYIQKDFGKFLAGSLVLSFGLLLLIFRNLKSALLPFIISLLSIVWLFGLIGLLGFKINLLSSLLPPILFFVSMSDAVHLMNALKKSEDCSRAQQVKNALKIVWIPTLLTSITTAIGFLSLIWINTEPVQLLGIFAAIGILFAFFMTFTAGLMLTSLTNYSSAKKSLAIPKKWWDIIQQKQHTIIIGYILIVLIMIPGIAQLKVNALLLDDLPPTSSIRKDFEYADKQLGGSKPYEMRITVSDSSLTIWDKAVMDEINKIDAYLTHQYLIANVQSPATIIKYLHMTNNGGLNSHYAYPSKKGDYKQALKLKRHIDPQRINQLVTGDNKTGRIIGFFPELGSHETTIRNNKMLDDFKKKIDHQILSYSITGTTYLIDKSHKLLSINLLKGLLTATLLIGIILALYFKSWKLLFISLIPNIIPLLVVAGLMGWLGISLKMTTSIIFTIAFGIAVDDTIHMMSYYLKNEETAPIKRMKDTFNHAGSAILITSIIMSSGFSLYLFSNFGATFYLGLFVSLSLLIALIVDLTLLPLLLINFRKTPTKV